MYFCFLLKCVVEWKYNKVKPSRGLRQGDPFSHYVFVLCMDKLSHIICDVVAKRKWTPMRIGKSGPYISHLMFMDDLILFREASIDQIDMVIKCLITFYKLQGRKLIMQVIYAFLKKC